MLGRALASARQILSRPRPLIPICLVFAGFSIAGDAPLAFFVGFAPVAIVVFAFTVALNASLFLELLADQDRRLAELDAAPA